MKKSLATPILLTLGILLPYFAAAQQGLGNIDPFQGTAGGSDLGETIRVIINGFLVLASIIAAVMIVYGGIQYVTAGLEGGSDRADKAKQTVIYALIGLLVIGLSAVLVNFTINAIPD